MKYFIRISFVFCMLMLVVQSSFALAQDALFDSQSLVRPWQITKIDDEQIATDDNVISFISNNQFNLKIGCHYYQGKYQTDGISDFRMSSLISVSVDCDENSMKVAKMANAFLIAEKFELKGEALTLMGLDNIPIIELIPGNSFKMPVYVKPSKKKASAKQKINSRHVEKKSKDSHEVDRGVGKKISTQNHAKSSGVKQDKTEAKKSKQKPEHDSIKSHKHVKANQS
jgi:META domain